MQLENQIALTDVAFGAKCLQIFWHSISALGPRMNMIDVKCDTWILGWTCAAHFTNTIVADQDKRPQSPIDGVMKCVCALLRSNDE